MRELFPFEKSAYVLKIKQNLFKGLLTQAKSTSDDWMVDIPKNTFNWAHSDGRIHATKQGENYHAVSASPYHPKFSTQIEPGVWPFIKTLLSKNYLTISSCEGHKGSQLFVTLAFGDIHQATKFFKLINAAKIVGVYAKQHDSYSNLSAYKTSSEIQFSPKKRSDHKMEAEGANLIFYRNHAQYYFVEFGLFKTVTTEDLFYRIKNSFLKKLFFKKSKQDLLDLLNSEHVVEHIG